VLSRIVKNCQELPRVAKSFQKLPKSCEKVPNIAKKVPKVAVEDYRLNYRIFGKLSTKAKKSIIDQ